MYNEDKYFVIVTDRGSKLFKKETKLGDILLNKDIIYRIVTEAVENCGGKAEILNYRGKYMNMVPGIAAKKNLSYEEYSGVHFAEDEDGLKIRVCIIVHFGASIKRVTNQIIDYIYEYVEKMFGIKPAKVTVLVTGTISKNIAKRHIEVSR